MVGWLNPDRGLTIGQKSGREKEMEPWLGLVIFRFGGNLRTFSDVGLV